MANQYFLFLHIYNIAMSSEKAPHLLDLDHQHALVLNFKLLLAAEWAQIYNMQYWKCNRNKKVLIHYAKTQWT